MPDRALTFGTVAESYERFRPAYPPELFTLVTEYAARPLVTALEIGAGTGKATRVFAGHGLRLTATDPDAAMLTELRKHVPADVRSTQAAFEDLPFHDERYDLVYAAAALHWTHPQDRCNRLATLLNPAATFASFGGPLHVADPRVEEAVRTARSPFLDRDDIPSPDGTPPDDAMQWPGTELHRSEWFTDVRQTVVHRRVTMSPHAYLGHLSTVSAYLVLPPAEREEVFSRIGRVLPERVEIVADITVHLAHRCPEQGES
ncbi:class I SAM-dependent methyltransferase [Streptomyces antibioticus]|uniref:class I SAM-dependent methyltransferase n=1 Tax=Streptomyces antibioticus TaxID=1890 RepID=UPI0037235047